MGATFLAKREPHGLSSMLILMLTIETEVFLKQCYPGNQVLRYPF